MYPEWVGRLILVIGMICGVYIYRKYMKVDVKPCKRCTVKSYDGHYKCMVCYKEFVVATEEDVMNMTQVAPALARIHELETENTTLREKLQALRDIMTAPRNPAPRKGYPGALVEDAHEDD
jgi:hypothetical protein